MELLIGKKIINLVGMVLIVLEYQVRDIKVLNV